MYSRFFPVLLTLLLPAASVLAQNAPAAAPAPGLRSAPLSYQVSAGAMFAGRFGSATYISPMATYQLTNRLQLFGGVTYLRTMPGAALGVQPGAEGAPRAGQLPGTNHYLLQGGGTYAVSPRLALTGSAWKDLTPTYPGKLVNPYAGFGNMGSGVNLRANFQVTENLSVSGGVRVSQGAMPISPLGLTPGGF